jgi:hypothetical protein
MTIRAGRALPVAAAVLGATAAAAWAGAAGNALYSGHTAAGHRPIYLRVSGDARTVTVDVPFPPLFCQGGGGLERRITRAAPIAGDGSFHGSITYEYRPNHRRNIRLYFSGRFSGRSATGRVRAEYLRARQCDGSTGYSARR